MFIECKLASHPLKKITKQRTPPMGIGKPNVINSYVIKAIQGIFKIKNEYGYLDGTPSFQSQKRNKLRARSHYIYDIRSSLNYGQHKKII